MNREKALMILNKYSPMPDDEELTEEIVEEYRAVIDYLDDKLPDIVFLRPLLHSLGAYDGWGVYETTRSLLLSYDQSLVIPNLIEGLSNKFNGRRYWCSLLASDFPDERLVPLLLETLRDSEEEIRINSVMALEFIGDRSVVDNLIQQIKCETDEEVIEVFEDAIQTLKRYT